MENRKKGEVSRKANADGSDARARAPKSVFAMAVRWDVGGGEGVRSVVLCSEVDLDDSTAPRHAPCLLPRPLQAMTPPPGIWTCPGEAAKSHHTALILYHSFSLIAHIQFARWLRPSSGRSLSHHCCCVRLAPGTKYKALLA